MPFDPRPLPHEVVIASDLHAARQVEDRIITQAAALGYSTQCAFAIRLAWAMERGREDERKRGAPRT